MTLVMKIQSSIDPFQGADYISKNHQTYTRAHLPRPEHTDIFEDVDAATWNKVVDFLSDAAWNSHSSCRSCGSNTSDETFING